MSSGANHVSLLFTGSIRNALKMMLEDSHQPIFGEAARMQLPSIERADFLEYLDFQFEATGKPAEEQALTHLLNLTRSHPRSTQQLAWETWANTPDGQPVTLEAVIGAHDRLVQTIERSEFASVLNVLASGDEGEVNEVRALQLLADRGGDTVTSRPLAALYGFSSHSRVRPALVRLQGRGSRRRAGRQLVHRRSALQRVAAPLIPAGRPPAALGAGGGLIGTGNPVPTLDRPCGTSEGAGSGPPPRSQDSLERERVHHVQLRRAPRRGDCGDHAEHVGDERTSPGAGRTGR